MKVYDYDKKTGEYLGQSTADEDQLQRGEWLIPANATTEAPPETTRGEVAVFQEGEWVTVADLRGLPYWTAGGAMYSVVDLHFELPEGCTWDEPEKTPLTVEEIEKLRAIAYSNSVTGSDRHFLEAARKRATGDEGGAIEAEQLGVARVSEIKEAIK